jgi:hypothetical protein
MKFKKGDKAIIKKPTIITIGNDIYWHKDMDKYDGQEITISFNAYGNIVHDGYAFPSCWLEPVEPVKAEEPQHFKNYLELMEYLIVPGNKVIHNDGTISFIRADGNVNNASTFAYPPAWKPYHEPKKTEWYENIPEKGVLCKVFGDRIVHIIDLRDGAYISDLGLSWNEATPHS